MKFFKYLFLVGISPACGSLLVDSEKHAIDTSNRNLQSCVSHSSYLGCFKNLNYDLALPYKVNGQNHDAKTCEASCTNLGYKYFAREWKGECYCGNSFDYEKHGSTTGCDCCGYNVGNNMCVWTVSAGDDYGYSKDPSYQKQSYPALSPTHTFYTEYPTYYPTYHPTKRPTKYPTKPPTPYPTRYPTNKPTDYPTKRPTKYPTEYPTEYPTHHPTPYPTREPTEYPTDYPTAHPTDKPTDYPTKRPTEYPTDYPTHHPTPYPTREPTEYPTDYPTPYPTNKPTEYPTNHPTPYPTREPTEYPTEYPTAYPTSKPTDYPTKNPTKRPTKYPTNHPTPYPTRKPTKHPTNHPTPYPTSKPTEYYPKKKPTKYPTKKPTKYPTSKPTIYNNTPYSAQATLYKDGSRGGFESFEHMGCRTSYGKKGSKWTGEYDLYKNVSVDTCQATCMDLGDLCFGFEYLSHRERCEVWKVPVDRIHLQYVYGVDCYIKH